MTRNMIFGGVMAGAIAIMAIASLLRPEPERSDDGWGVKVSISGDEIVIEEDMVRTADSEVNCRKNGGSVTITRANGQEVTIICD